MSVHLVNLLLVNLMDREPLELEAGTQLAPGHSELSDWAKVTMNASYWSITHLGTIVHFCTVAARLIALLLAL